MKMARAGEQDLKAALDVSRIIDHLDRGYMPGQQDDDGVELFDQEDADQCKHALAAILDAADQGSMFRVTFGMGVLLDPRNKLLDPAADTLELHPDHVRNARDAERWRYIRRKLCLTGNGDGTCTMQAINLPDAIPGWPKVGAEAEFFDAAIDEALAAQQQEPPHDRQD